MPIVASHIRELNSNDASINQSLSAVAANDDFVSVIDISDASIYTPVSTNDVHLNAEGFLVIANDFAEQMIELQSGVDVLKGDVNMDGEVTFLDISPFITALTSAGPPAEADCNCDGSIDFLDISPFIGFLIK